MPEQKPKSTVRKRDKNFRASTQRFLPIAEIRSDTVLLKNGGYRAVLEVEALNFNLKSETEQQGIIAGYGAFMNTLGFPLQIVVRSTKTNIDTYLEQMRAIGEKHENELLKQQTLSYVSFMQRLIEVAEIMQKHFYVVVSLDKSLRKKTLVEQFFDWIHPEDSMTKASARNREFAQGARELKERVELVQTGLNSIGLHANRMTTRGLIDLYYQIYNPKTSQHQKIPTEMEQLKTEKGVL